MNGELAYLFLQAGFDCESSNLRLLLLDRVELARLCAVTLSQRDMMVDRASILDAFAAFPLL